MKVDREVPMGMMGCLQILLGGGDNGIIVLIVGDNLDDWVSGQ